MDYQVGGTLPPNNPHYVEREADQKLFHSLIKGEFCYVFNSRQTGKSSLQVHVRKNLEAQGIICAYIDLSSIDTNSDLESWYLTIIDEISVSLLPEIDIFDWWDEIPNQNILAKFSKFFHEVLLKEIQENIIIFVDEIDTVLSLNFSTDDFFRFIRSCHNKRALKSEYQRLTFCLLGVTDPSYLISNKENTPFNIGTAIELKGFNFTEAQKPLTTGLKEQLANPQQVLQEVLDWTNGQPFLTIKILSLLSEKKTDSVPNISEFVQTYVIKNWESQDHPEHLKTIRDRLFSPKKLTKKILILYQDIIHSQKTNKPIKINNNIDEAQIELLLSGLVVKKNGHLIVNNKIYQSIFNLNWIKEELTKLFTKEKPLWYVEKITQWLNSNRQDKSTLLTPKELINFQTWIGDNKRLNKEDLAFLYQSTKEAERRSQQAKEEALKAELQATEEKKKAYKILARLAIFTTLIIISSLGFLLHTNKQEKQTQLAEKLVQSAQIEYPKNIERSLLLYTEALKHQPSISLPLNFYQQLSLLSPLKKIFLIDNKENNSLDNKFAQSSVLCNEQHNNSMTAVAFSFQGNLFATANLEGKIHIWDSAKILNNYDENEFQNCSYLLKSINNKSGINALNFSKDNKYLAIANNDGKILVLNLDTEELITLAFSHKTQILSLKFSPNNKYLITGDLQGLVKVWDIDNTKVINELQLASGINDIAFTSEGQLLAITSGNKIYISEIDSGKKSPYIVPDKIQSLTLNSAIFSLNFSPNGKYLAIGSADNTAKIFQIDKIENKQECITPNCQFISLKEKKIFKHKNKVNIVKFSPDSQFLLTGSDDNSAKLWSIETGYLITQTFHSTPVLEVAFLSPQQIATISWDYSIKIWDNLSKRVVKSIDSEKTWQNIAFNFDNNYLATNNANNHLQLWNLDTATLNSQVNLEASVVDNIHDLYVSSQGNYLVYISNNKVQIWQKNNQNQWTQVASLLHPDNVHQVIINQQENYLVTVCDDRNLRIWDLKKSLTNKPHQIIKINREIETVLFTQNNNLVVSDRQRNNQSLSLQQISFFQPQKLAKKQLINQGKKQDLFRQAKKNLDRITHFNIAKNKPLLITINDNNNLCIWHIKDNDLSKRKCKSMLNHSYDFVILDANGKYFASVEDGTKVKILPSQTLTQEITISHQDNIKELILSEDSQYLATITVKNKLRVWDMKQCQSHLFPSSCQPILNFTEEDRIDKMVLRKDGDDNYIAIALADKIIQIRLNNISELVEREICPLLSRNLTRQEWNQYLDSEAYNFTCDRVFE